VRNYSVRAQFIHFGLEQDVKDEKDEQDGRFSSTPISLNRLISRIFPSAFTSEGIPG